MFLTYLVTTRNETKTLDQLLEDLIKYKTNKHQIVVLDDYSDNEETLKIFEKYIDNIKLYKHHLELDYGAHKNYGKSLCDSEYIFQIDADERVNKYLLYNIDEVIDKNNKSELIWIPRLNYFSGLTTEVARTWRWRIKSIKTLKDTDEFNINSSEYNFLKSKNLILSEEQINEFNYKVEFLIPFVNYPDYQGRIYKNVERIHYERKLHERITGNITETYIPSDQYVLSLMHKKTVKEQLETNKRYNELFSREDNMGFRVKG